MTTLPMAKPDVQRSARVLKCTPDQIKQGFARNAADLFLMWSKAKTAGGTYRGFTEAELLERATEYMEAAK